MTDTESPSSRKQISVLYVDDEPDLLMIGKVFLERTKEFSIVTLTSATEALKSSHIETFDAIVSDYQMPGMDGIAFLKAVREQFGSIPFILFTGRGREEVVIEAINNGVDFYLQKGGDPHPLFAELSHKIKQAVGKKQAERLLQNSEKRLFDIIEFLPDATFAIDQSGQVIAWNRAIEELTGFSSGVMLGKGNYEYAIPLYGSRRPILIDLIGETDEEISNYYTNVKRSGNSLTAESDFLIPGGYKISAYAKVSPLYNQEGEIMGAIESIRDVTDIRKSELDLRESEMKFRNLTEYSRDGILIVGFDGNIFFINPTGLLMVDADDCNTIVGKQNVMEYIHPESQEIVITDISHVAQGIDGYISQYKLITAKKREIWVETVGRKIPYRQSEAILVSLRDITGRKLAEEALQKSEEQFRAFTEQSPDIIMRVDRDYRILYGNPRITTCTGIPLECLIGTDSRKFFGHDDSVSSWTFSVRKVFEIGLSKHIEFKIESGKWYNCLCYPEFAADKTVRTVICSVRDITHIKRNEEEREIYYKDLFVQREFTQALLDAIPIPVYWKDTNQRYMGCNQAFARLIGMSEDELIGTKYGDIWSDKESEEIAHLDRQLLSRRSIHPCQRKLTDRAGKTHEVIHSKNIFCDYQGNIAGIVGAIQDITENIHLLQDLKNREELFRMIVTQSSDLFIILTPHLEVTYISPGVEHLSGFLMEEILGPIERYVHPDDFKRLVFQIERLIQNPSSTEYAEFQTLKRDGSYLLLEGQAVNCLDNPAIRGILITARDITSRRKTELELARRMKLFHIVADSSPAYFALLDSQGTILFGNHVCAVHLGISDFSTSPVSIKGIFSSDCLEKCNTILTDIVKTRTPSVHELQIPGINGNVIISALFFPIQEEENILIGFIGLDITENKNLRIKLDESLIQNTVLEKLVQERTEEVSNLLDLKDSLITGIAHEIRTPLTPLTVLPSLLGEEENSSKRMEIIRIIEKNTARIANIIEKILFLANLGAIYKIEDIKEENIFTIIENLIEVYRITAEKKEITIINEVPSYLMIFTSPPHLISVLDNIISNAIKYSKNEGTILISADENVDNIILRIHDDGIGMSREDLDRIFDPFFKADPSRHDRSSPGLGLSVTKRLIQAIGGEIFIDSKGPDLGTEVILTFKKNIPYTNLSTSSR